jgi:lipoprotein-releasing system permease protein
MSIKGKITRRIANRMSSANSSASSWAKPVIRIATAGISLGLALIIISTAIVQGFQSEIRDLVIGFGSHIQITPIEPDNDGIVLNTDLLSEINELKGVKSIAPLYLNAGLLETTKSLKGVSVKGIDLDDPRGFNSNSDMISEALIYGKLPTEKSDVLISSPLAKTLELDTNDRVSLYLVIKNEDVKPRVVRVCGIYETGLLEYDERFIFVQSTLLQEVSNRGVQAVIYLTETSDRLDIRGASFGKTLEGEEPLGRWEPKIELQNPDTLIEYAWIVGGDEVQDTAHLFFSEGKWNAQAGDGSWTLFADGYEVYIDNFEDLATIDDEIWYTIPHTFTTNKITEQSIEIFSWLGMLDLNVVVIIGLMVLISIINMVSALLIVILERRPQVGLLKALGMRDSSVIRLFVQYATRIIGGGFLIGNIIGFTVCLIQKQTGLITLDPNAYYVSEVPILFDFSRLLFIEGVAFSACVVSMFLPAWYSTRILPSTALRIK